MKSWVGIVSTWIAVTLFATLGSAALALRMMSPASVIENLAKNNAEICIQAGNGQFLSVNPTDTRYVLANQNVCGTGEIFQVVKADDESYALYSVSQKTYLSCQPDGRLEGNRTRLGQWEKFTIDGEIRGDLNRMQGPRFYVFQLQCLAHQKRFVSAEGNGGGAVSAKSPKAGNWETFKIAPKGKETMKPIVKPTPVSDRRFPAHWGQPPRIQTKDLRPLPGGYGRGSSTLAKWIQMNLDRDAAKAGIQDKALK